MGDFPDCVGLARFHDADADGQNMLGGWGVSV